MSTEVERVTTSKRTLAPKVLWLTAAASFLVSLGVFLVLSMAGLTAGFDIVATVLWAAILYVALSYVMSRIVEGKRKATDRLVAGVVTSAFVIALLPLISLIYTTVADGLNRLDGTFFSSSMRNIVGEGGEVRTYGYCWPSELSTTKHAFEKSTSNSDKGPVFLPLFQIPKQLLVDAQ